MDYKEKFELAKSWYNDARTTEKEKVLLAKMFPELKESEDEGIRRHIVKFVDEQFPTHGNLNAEKEKMLNYLEKQKDSDKAQLAVELIDKYIDEHTANAHEMSDSFPDKKYYSGVDDTLSNIAGILIKAYSEEGQKKQKDYRKLYEEVVKSDWFKENYAGKSLGDDEKQKEQQPAEWSEEDEDMRYKATVVLNKLCASKKEFIWQPGTLIKIFNWLESLRPQPHWKPSAHTLFLVKKVADGEMLTGVEQLSMKTIYEQLKKLYL